VVVHPTEKIFQKNTGDLQWKMRANCNASLCASLRKTAGAKAMESNEKSNAKNNATGRTK